MNLPHLAPILFAKEVLESNEKEVIIQCSFPYSPSLAMLCEAAAQSSAAFIEKKQEDPQIGYLVSLKDISQIKEIKECEYNLRVRKNAEIGNMCEYEFEVLLNNTLYSKGTFTVVLP